MNGRANTGLLVAAVTAGIVLVALATATGSAARSRSGPLMVSGCVEPCADLQLDPVAREHTRGQAREQWSSSAAFVHEPALGAELTFIALDLNDQPVPGAELLVLEPDQSEWDLDERLTAFERDPLSEVRSHGTTFKCDEFGRVHLPRPKRRMAVLASAGELGAFESVEPGAVSPWMVTLQPHHALEVRAWDERGAPVPGLPFELHDAKAGPLWNGRTDANGRAVIESLAYGLLGHEEVVVLTAAIPVSPPIERWLPGDLSSPGVVDLVIPSGKTTTVRLVDTRARLLDQDGLVNVQLSHPRAACETAQIRVPVHHGSAVIRGIPNGCDELFVWTHQADGKISTLANGLWPATFDLILDEGFEHLRFLVRDAEGRPLANRRIDWGQDETWTGETVLSHFDDHGVTDARGELSCFVHFAAESEDGVEKGVRFFEVADCAAWPPLRAAVTFDAIRAAPAGELFPVSLTPVPLALSGRVVDELGAPVVEARVEARRHAGVQTDELRTFGEVFTDSGGRFMIFSPLTSAPVGVNVLVDGNYVCSDGPDKAFAFGTSGIELVARSWATIEGQLLVDAKDRDRDYEVEAWRDDVDHGDPDIWNEGGGWHWRVQGLDEGTYSLRVTVDGEPLCTIDDVRVPASALVLDPRCLPIDLRGRVPAAAPAPVLEREMRTLHFVDAHGVAIDHGTWRYAVAEEWHAWKPWQGGEVQVFEAFERVQAWSPGCFLREGPAPERESTWTLEPSRSIEVALELPAELRSSRMQFQTLAELITDDGRDLNQMFGDFDVPATLDSSGRAVFRVPAGNEWKITVSAEWDVDQDREGRQLESFHVKLGNEPAGDAFKLTPKVEEWLKTLREANAPIAPQRD